MGCNKSCRHVFYTIFSLLLSSSSILNVYGSESYDPASLDVMVHDRARNALVRRRTGVLIDVSLPSNFSGMQISAIRLRTNSLWERGANYSSFYFPPRLVPYPFVKRLSLIFQNLGIWSSHYYQIPGYSLVAPVIGFAAYDATNVTTLGNQTLKFSFMNVPILVHFPQISVKDKNVTLRCVKFSTNGLVQFMNMTLENTCITESDGHFSVAVPSPTGKQKKKWRRWVLLVGAGVFGLFLLCVIIVTSCKLVRSKRIREMEEEAETGVALDTIWIGRSKMPSASMTRTQPALEHEYVL